MGIIDDFLNLEARHDSGSGFSVHEIFTEREFDLDVTLNAIAIAITAMTGGEMNRREQSVKVTAEHSNALLSGAVDIAPDAAVLTAAEIYKRDLEATAIQPIQSATETSVVAGNVLDFSDAKASAEQRLAEARAQVNNAQAA